MRQNHQMRWATLFETIAARLLARQGIGLIWQLHLRASASHLGGNWLAAAALIGIADAAERRWTHRASVPNQKFLSTMGLDGDRAVTKPFDGGQDVVGGFGPAKGLGVGIAGVDVGGDGGLQRGGRAVGAALDLLVGEQREEALDLVDP